MPSFEMDVDQNTLMEVIRGWMGGLTYKEISNMCNINVDRVLELICKQIGYQLQEFMTKLCQLAIEYHGEKNVSEMARSWASLLQYGLGTLQQLDIFERGGSDRLGAWGISRFLVQNNIQKRGEELIEYIRINKEFVKATLINDARVPSLSVQRICEELKIS
jgi:hypothetical protein